MAGDNMSPLELTNAFCFFDLGSASTLRQHWKAQYQPVAFVYQEQALGKSPAVGTPKASNLFQPSLEAKSAKSILFVLHSK